MFRSLIPASVLLVAVVAACNGTAATPVPTTAPTPTPAATPTPSPAPTLSTTVALAPAGFFVGSNGMTLYTFDNDTLGTSNCTSAQCAGNWPALILPGGVQLTVGAGLQAADFAFITRADGGQQVTFKNIPLYNFAGDSAVGDTNGEGVGGVWHTATMASTLPVATASPTATATATASTAASSTPTAEATACFDNDGYQIPCPSDSAGGPTVSVSAAGNLVTSTGMSLYTYDNDTTENQSACNAECATSWPALTIATGQAVSVGAGVDLEDFTTFDRTDGGIQVAYYAKPLYLFAADTAPGDTNGDGVGGVWHLAKPQ
jgi:predicted lipoprotein with Yx(FWY)xxD motif